VIDCGLVCSAAYHYLATAKQAQEAPVTSDRRQPSLASLPAAVAAVLAAFGVAGMIFLFVSAEQVATADVGMKSADAVYRAGATITPTSPDTKRSLAPAPSIRVADEVRNDL